MVEALGISLLEIIFAIVNFLILVGVLTKFLYKPTIAMFDRRKATIKQTLENAEAINKRADMKLDNYNKRIARVEDEAREIIKNSKIKAEAQAKTIIDDAREEAVAMKAAAQAEIERERQKARSDMRNEIAALAMLAAEKIIERELQSTGQDEIIDGILEQAGTAGWQN